MKTNKSLIAIAFGLLATGLAVYFFSTEKGKKASKNWRKKGNRIVDDFKEIIEEMTEKCEQKVKEKSKEFA